MYLSHTTVFFGKQVGTVLYVTNKPLCCIFYFTEVAVHVTTSCLSLQQGLTDWIPHLCSLNFHFRHGTSHSKKIILTKNRRQQRKNTSISVTLFTRDCQVLSLSPSREILLACISCYYLSLNILRMRFRSVA